MSRKITQPVNQVRLTNVAVVRINRGGKRFEVACYRNKIVNYRQGLETDLSEVLQTDRVFTNVSKGQFAKSSDLQKAFGTSDDEEVCRIILDTGQVQVSDKERSAQLEGTVREVATMVASNCVDPRSGRPYTVSQIRDAMREAEFAVHPTKSVKRQFLECVKLLKAKGVLPIERAKMELAVTAGGMRREDLEETLRCAGVEEFTGGDDGQGGAGTCRVSFLIDPRLYRDVDALVKDGALCGSGARLEIVRQVVTEEGDANLESELVRKSRAAAAAAASSREEGGVDRADDDRLDGGDEEEVDALAQRLAAVGATASTGPTEVEIDDVVTDMASPQAGSSRKNQKKAQKKSKKAKRREKEEAAERQARIEAERVRREEREARGAAGGRSADAAPPAGSANAGGGEGDEETKACNTCGGSFTAAQYRSHFRSDWHRYNIKLRMKGVPAVTEKEFLMCDSDAFFEDAM